MKRGSPRVGVVVSVFLIAFLLGSERVGRAQSSPVAPMPPDLQAATSTYFGGEYAQGFAWLAAGNASLAIGGAFLAQDSPTLRGASYPLLAVGLIQFVAGISSLARSDGRLAALQSAAVNDAKGVRDRETDRIGRINRLFKIIKGTEYTLLGVGAAGAVAGGVLKQDQVMGAGVGLAVEAALMLTLDHFAEARAHRYAEALSRVSLSVVPRPESTAVTLGFAGTF